MTEILHFGATKIRHESAIPLTVHAGSPRQMLALASVRDGAQTSRAVSAQCLDVCSCSPQRWFGFIHLVTQWGTWIFWIAAEWLLVLRTRLSSLCLQVPCLAVRCCAFTCETCACFSAWTDALKWPGQPHVSCLPPLRSHGMDWSLHWFQVFSVCYFSVMATTYWIAASNT